MDGRDKFLLAVLSIGLLLALAYLATPLVPAPDLHPLRSKYIELLMSGLSAAGTLAAVVVALWLGREAQRKLERTEMHRATLTAAKIAHEVHWLYERVKTTDTMVTFAETTVEQVADIANMARQIAPALDRLKDDDYLSLMILPNHVGGRLAATVSRLRLLCQNAEALNPLDGSDALTEAAQTLDAARDTLWVVYSALYALSSGVAPELTDEEKYGDPLDYLDSQIDGADSTPAAREA